MNAIIFLFINVETDSTDTSLDVIHATQHKLWIGRSFRRGVLHTYFHCNFTAIHSFYTLQ